jgi:phytoene dehydrogenase-like protein
MPTHYFDVIIIGSDPAGLVAGALLKRRGYRILQVDHMESPGIYLHDGYPLPCSPVMLPPVDQSYSLSSVFREMALAPSTYREIGSPVERFQSLVPGHRLDLWHDPDLLKSELAREFPRKKNLVAEILEELDERAGQVAAFMRESPPLPPHGFWEGRRLRKIVSGFPAVSRGRGIPGKLSDDNVLDHVLCSPLGLLARAGDFESTPAGAYALRSMFAQGWQVSPSIHNLKSLLKKRMRDLGAILLPGPRPSEIHVEGSRVVGLTLEKNSLTYNCANMLIAMPASQAVGLLPSGRKQRRFETLAAGVEHEQCALTINLIAPSATVPEGMGNAVFLSGSGTDGPGRAPIFLGLFPVMRNKVLQKDEVLISATMIVARGKLEKDRASTVSKLKAELLERMARPFPFVVEKAAVLSTPYDAERMSDVSGVSHSLDDFRPAPVARFAGKPQAGLAALPSGFGWGNLMFASGQVFPGLGVDGEFFCGKTVADLLTRLNPKKV